MSMRKVTLSLVKSTPPTVDYYRDFAGDEIGPELARMGLPMTSELAKQLAHRYWYGMANDTLPLLLAELQADLQARLSVRAGLRVVGGN